MEVDFGIVERHTISYSQNQVITEGVALCRGCMKE